MGVYLRGAESTVVQKLDSKGLFFPLTCKLLFARCNLCGIQISFPFSSKKSMCQNLFNAWNKIHFEISVSACSYSHLLPLLEKSVLSCLVPALCLTGFVPRCTDCSSLHGSASAEMLLGYRSVPAEKDWDSPSQQVSFLAINGLTFTLKKIAGVVGKLILPVTPSLIFSLS